jgi:hypothetical protein
VTEKIVNGAFLRQETETYVIIRHNIRTYRSDGVVEVVKGSRRAEVKIKIFQDCQPSADRLEGWRYFLETTYLPPGTNPVEATRLRQADLEIREIEAGKRSVER